MSKLQYKRLLVKFSGEAVAGDDVHGIDPKILDHMANSVKVFRAWRRNWYRHWWGTFSGVKS